MSKTAKNRISQDTALLPNLPLGWCWAELGQLSAAEPNSITDGPFGSNLKTEHYTSSGPRVIRLQNVGDAVFRDVFAHISEDHFHKLQKHRAYGGDLVIAALGESLPKACIVPEGVGPAIVKADCIRFKPEDALVSPAYLNLALNSPVTSKRTATIIHGVGRPRLNLGEIKRIAVPLSPRNEQGRIVAKIDELFSDLDAGVAALARAKANLKRYRAAVLKAAVEGKLTEQWRAEHPGTEPAAELLERILAGRRKKWEADQLAKYAAAGKTPPNDWRVKYVEPAGPDAAELPQILDGWCWVTVEQMLREPTCNGISVKGSANPPGVPALRLSAMSSSGFDYQDRRYIPIDAADAAALAVHEGDFFVSRGNGSLHLLGRGTLAQAPEEQIVFPDTMIRLRFIKVGVLAKLFSALWASRVIRKQIEKKGRTTAGIFKISQRDVEAFCLPLPPLVEQEQILTEVERQLSVVAATEGQIEADLRRAARLRQAILKRAFEGKLVAQDPADEPASVLLARIRASREGEARILLAARAARARPAASGVRRKQPAGNIFRRGAVASYIIRTLADRPSFGRTQLGKVLHLTQAHLGVDLALEFERYPAGPLDTAIYKLEGFARKQGWFGTEDRPSIGVRYRTGPNIGERCDAAAAILGEKRAAVDELLAHVAKMDADGAELFATVYAAWNDLLLDGKAASEAAIIAEVYGWDESKKRFPEARITRCMAWMRKHGYIPTGTGQRTQLRPPVSEKKSRRGGKKP